MAEKAPRRGKYLLNGITFRIQAGDDLPAGAVFVDERAEKSAPQNRAEKAAPANRSAKKRAKKDD